MPENHGEEGQHDKDSTEYFYTKDAVSGNVWVGVDVHKNSYSVTILDENGRNLNFTMPADPLKLTKKVILRVRNYVSRK